MTPQQLNQAFNETQTTPRDFIRWVNDEFAESVQDATISRHRAGTQGITVPWAIAYKSFFSRRSGVRLKIFKDGKEVPFDTPTDFGR